MNKVPLLFLIFLLISNCSFNDKSKLWTKSKNIEPEKDLVIKELFKEEESINKEFNPNLIIQLNSKLNNNSFINNLSNNNGRVNYVGNLKTTSRYKFATIKNFDQFEPEIIFDKENIIFFDNKGTVLKFDKFSKLTWEKNFYNKNEKKLKPRLSFASNKDILIVVDNLANYYALNIKTGELLWKKSNSSPFNSQVKIYEDKFFVTDFENNLRCFSLKEGVELWNIKTDTTFIKSQKKLSLIIIDEKIFFNNSIGDISAVDILTGTLIWQTPTQDSTIYESAFLLKTSDLISDNKSILFSNNKNEFFSLHSKTGTLNWKQKINSNLRSSVTDNLIFTVSMEGFLVVTNNINGNIIRVTDVFDRLKPKKRSEIKPSGFVVGKNNIYLTTDNGLLIVVDIYTGRSSLVLKIDNNKISRPFILNDNLFIIKENAIIKLN